MGEEEGKGGKEKGLTVGANDEGMEVWLSMALRSGMPQQKWLQGSSKPCTSKPKWGYE